MRKDNEIPVVCRKCYHRKDAEDVDGCKYSD